MTESIILASHIRATYERQGTLKDWREGAGRLAKGHRLATLAISTALASPLLHVAGYESGGVHVHGRSSIGKTSSLRLAASVWGRGAEGGSLRSWRSTANALEATLAGACDVGLVIDEIGQIDGRELGAALYMAANGVGKQRMRADASLRDAYTWRLLVLSSGEDPIEAKLNEDKKRNVRAEQLARMLDVPVSRDNGAFGENLTDFDGGTFAAESMRAATTAYGTAGPEFVRRLFASSLTPGVSGARDETRNAVDAFVSKIGLRLDGQTLRAAQRFGLIAFAGELAVENGLVPWELGSGAETARWAFDRWLEARGGVIPYEARRAVAQVRHFLEAHGDSRFEDLDLPPDPDRKPVINRAGFREGKGENRCWYVPPEIWRQQICEGLDAHDVAQTLVDLGMLVPGADKLAKPKKVGGKTQRFYTLKPEIFDGWGEKE
jgi:putative DNA primase/helicase